MKARLAVMKPLMLVKLPQRLRFRIFVMRASGHVSAGQLSTQRPTASRCRGDQMLRAGRFI
jgi:hypothetical protein